MNYPFPSPSPYIQAAMAQAVQAMMSGGPLPPNCVVMSLPYHQQNPSLFPPMILNPQGNGPTGQGPAPPANVFGPSPYPNAPQTRALVPYSAQTPPIYNYPNSPHQTKNKSKKKNSNQPHSNIYNSSSFDTYMEDLSWSRLFDRSHHQHARKSSKQDRNSATNDDKSNSSKKPRTNSTDSSTSSTTSDETIRRVNVSNPPASNNLAPKTTPKGTLPFKYSSEFVPGLGKQQSSKSKTHERKQ